MTFLYAYLVKSATATQRTTALGIPPPRTGKEHERHVTGPVPAFQCCEALANDRRQRRRPRGIPPRDPDNARDRRDHEGPLRRGGDAYGKRAFHAAMGEFLARPGCRPESAERLAWARLSERLWNDIEHVEFFMNRRWRSAQLAWEITAALPRVLSAEGRIRLLRDYVTEAFRDHRTAWTASSATRATATPMRSSRSRPGRSALRAGAASIGCRATRAGSSRCASLGKVTSTRRWSARVAASGSTCDPSRTRAACSNPKARPEDRGQRGESGRHVPREVPGCGGHAPEPGTASE